MRNVLIVLIALTIPACATMRPPAGVQYDLCQRDARAFNGVRLERAVYNEYCPRTVAPVVVTVGSN